MQENEDLYYAMNLPEVLCVIFVLFLWMLSIFFFIRHFRKISTIERSGVYINSNNSIDTTKQNKLTTKPESTSLLSICSQQNVPYQQQHHHLHQQHINTKSISIDTYNELSVHNIRNLTISSGTNSTHTCKKNRNLSNKDDYLSITNTFADATIRKATQMPVHQTQVIQRSCSEPVINNDDLEPLLLRGGVSSSIDKTNSNRLNFIDNFSSYSKRLTDIMSTKQNYDANKRQALFNRSHTTSESTGNAKIVMKKQSTVTSEVLLDPNRIPKVIRKSLIDLHKKSVWNLGQHSVGNQNTKSLTNQYRHSNTTTSLNKRTAKGQNRHSEHFV